MDRAELMNCADYTDDNFRSHFTTAPAIRALMFDLLGDVNGANVLEPSAGRGAFLDGLRGTPSCLDAVDIDPENIEFLRRQAPSFVSAIHADFVDAWVTQSLPTIGLKTDYDAVIANPPYGLRFSLEYRKKIKRLYGDIYARESYGLFMHFAISALRSNGRYVFIVPDTFLTAHNHRPLRRFLAREAAPRYIYTFPSAEFETVSFGYGRLCIIAGAKTPLIHGHRVTFVDIDSLDDAGRTDLETVVPADRLLARVDTGWSSDQNIEALAEEDDWVSLGEVADCKTGLYTGANTRFLGYDTKNPPKRTANGHPIEWEESVARNPLDARERLGGIVGPRHYVPIVRGGHRAPVEQTQWAVDWSEHAVNFYRTDSKARLQNLKYYFSEGLAIPMVTSQGITASLIRDGEVFDQGVVGVFPHSSNWLSYLLIYLNTPFVSGPVKDSIAPGANNSANYIKRVPVPVPTEEDLNDATYIVAASKRYGWEAMKAQRSALVQSVFDRVRTTTNLDTA